MLQVPHEYGCTRLTAPLRSGLADATQVGLSAVLDRSELIGLVVTSLYASGPRQRTATLDLLVALCVVSHDEGLYHVLAAFSDARATYGELHRFEWLVHSLAFRGESEEDDPEAWTWYTTVLAFLNALCGSVEELEERCEVRSELGRRGLSAVIQVSRASVGVCEADRRSYGKKGSPLPAFSSRLRSGRRNAPVTSAS